MNEHFDLTGILNGCPEGTKFYSTIFGDVEFMCITDIGSYSIVLKARDDYKVCVDSKGRYLGIYNGECILFPSREQRDWSKFTAPWLKKEKLVEVSDKFDPKTLKPFDRVLVKLSNDDVWGADFFSHYNPLEKCMKYVCVANLAVFCIPYNEETKHLVGTTDEAPEFYRYWED